jgi:hypothetical protein
VRRRTRSYTAYSIGCVIVWSLILAITRLLADDKRREHIQIVCAGWWLGWLSATIARYGYPPPKRYRRDA